MNFRLSQVGRFLDKTIAYLGYAGAAVGVVGISLMILMITGNVFLRYLFNKPQLFVEELAAYFLVAVVFLGFAYTARKGAHVTVDLVVRRLSKRVRDSLDVVTSLMVLGCMSIYLWFSWKLFWDHIETQRESLTTLGTPQWIPVTLVWVGFVFLCLEIIAHIVKKLRHFQKGSREVLRGGA